MYTTVGQRRSDGRLGAAAILAGAAVALAAGAYGRLHTATGVPSTTFMLFDVDLGSTMLRTKSWLTTVVVALAVLQLLTGLRVRGVLRWPAVAPLWLDDLHRLLGTLALLCSVPVAYHCLWSLGFRTGDVRVLAHSLLGCFFYGLFVTKELAVRVPRMPERLVPVTGGVLFATVVGVWATSALLFLGGRL